MKQVDMSSEAISRRLRMASQLRDLSISLSKAKPLTIEEANELRRKNREERESEQERLTKNSTPVTS